MPGRNESRIPVTGANVLARDRGILAPGYNAALNKVRLQSWHLQLLSWCAIPRKCQEKTAVLCENLEGELNRGELYRSGQASLKGQYDDKQQYAGLRIQVVFKPQLARSYLLLYKNKCIRFCIAHKKPQYHQVVAMVSSCFPNHPSSV